MDDVTPIAAILCGGRGTRLGTTLGGLPKPMAPIGGRPLLERLVRWALNAGSPRVILCTGFGADVIRNHFSTPEWAASVAVSEEQEALGTGGALRLALPLLGSSPILVLNGDSFLPGFDPANFFAFHREQMGARGTLVLTLADQRTDTGNVVLETATSAGSGAGGRIRSFAEKAPLAGHPHVNAGIYLFDRSLIAAIPPHRPISLERDLLPAWIDHGLYGYIHAGSLVDIGTPERLRAAQAAKTGTD